MPTSGTTTTSGTAGTADDDGRDLASAAFAVGRRFAAGGTMWCVGPVWAEHARHIAVEFVHPVIVGKRALPAVTVEGADPIAALRPVAACGDVLVLVGDAATPGGRELLRRAPAWGLTTVWIGAGPRPAGDAADHVLWVDAVDAASSRHDGSIVRLYHVLWELTHVCFEHAGLLTAGSPQLDDGPVCAVCADEARSGEVLVVDDDGTARVRTAAGVETVDTTLVGPVASGDLVLIHAGTAIALVDDQ
jgi:hypothetical protein